MTSNKCTLMTIHETSEVPLEPINGKPTLVYWDIVGLAHPLRMALALSGVEWNDVRLVCGTSPTDTTTNKKAWYPAKQMLRDKNILEFPNLPYYMEDNGGGCAHDKVRLVQSDAILRYLGHKYNLMGKTISPQVPEHLFDMLLEEARDLDSTLIRLSYEEGAEAVAKWLSHDQELREKLNVWENYIHHKTDGPFVLGTHLTIVDLKLYTFLYKFQHAQAELMVSSMSGVIPEKDVPSLPFWVPAYLEDVKTATPELEAYLNSPDSMQTPINNPHARFDNL